MSESSRALPVIGRESPGCASWLRMCLRNAMRVKTSAAMHNTKTANNTRMAILLKDNKVEDGRAIRMIV